LRVFFDTSVLVAASVEPHPMHERSLVWVKRAKAEELEMLVASHTIAELYGVLTTLPVRPRISPDTAVRLILENVRKIAKVVPLSVSDYEAAIERLAELGIPGGAVYDALIARAAKKSGAERFLTLNAGDFERVWPEGKSLLSLP
jgi:predicted nucleic acid-binding protein